MLESLYHRILKLATWPVVSLLLVAFMSCQLAFEWRKTALSDAGNSPDAMFGYSPTELASYYEALGRQGQNLYAWTQVTLDVLFPSVYCLLFATLTAQVFTKRWGQYMVLAPCTAAAADLCENFLLAFLAWSFHQQPSPWAWLAAGFTVTKWLCLIVALLQLLFGSVNRIRLTESATDSDLDNDRSDGHLNW